jgi:outer membrane protein, heavy metal efflux system
MKRVFPSLILVLTLAGWILQPARAAVFSCDQAVAQALGHNADLDAARITVAEARGRRVQAGRLSNPEVEAAIRPHANGRERLGEFGITQRFPLTARLRLAKDVSRLELAAAEAEVADAERRLAGEVRTAVTQMLVLAARMDLRRRLQSNSVELAEFARKTAAAGEGPGIDALQFDLETSQHAIRLNALEAEANVLRAQLRPLLGMSDTEELSFSGSLAEPQAPPPVPKLLENRRPDQVAAAARTGAAQEAVRLARAGKWEDAGLGFFGEIDRNEDGPFGLQTDHRVGIRLSVPLPLWNRNRGRIDEASATVRRVAMEAEALGRRVRSEIAAADSEMRGAFATLRGITDSLLPQARAIEDRIKSARAVGQASFTDLLRARDRRLELESARIDALAGYHLAAVRLQTAVGGVGQPSKTR